MLSEKLANSRKSQQSLNWFWFVVVKRLHMRIIILQNSRDLVEKFSILLELNINNKISCTFKLRNVNVFVKGYLIIQLNINNNNKILFIN